MDKEAKIDRRPIISLKRMASNVVRSNWNDDSDDSEWKEIVTQTLFDIEWSKMKVEDWWTRETKSLMKGFMKRKRTSGLSSLQKEKSSR